MFWTILLGIGILVVGVAGAVAFLNGVIDSWELAGSIACLIGLVVWIAVCICVGIWYVNGPLTKTFPEQRNDHTEHSYPRSEVDITGVS